VTKKGSVREITDWNGISNFGDVRSARTVAGVPSIGAGYDAMVVLRQWYDYDFEGADLPG
jgi:hypothetical protein